MTIRTPPLGTAVPQSLVRLRVILSSKEEWGDVFLKDAFSIKVATTTDGNAGAPVRLELAVGLDGPKLLLRGILGANDGTHVTVMLNTTEVAKTEYLSGYARGGLLDLRKTRRLPIRLAAAYSTGEPIVSHTRDINEYGVFIVTKAPLAEETILDFELKFPRGWAKCRGRIGHTVVVEDEDVPGMGIIFQHDDDGGKMATLVGDLEDKFLAGLLPEEFLL